MSEAIIIVLIVQLANIVVSWLTHRAVNSRMDELLRLAKTSEFAKGLLEGKKDGG